MSLKWDIYIRIIYHKEKFGFVDRLLQGDTTQMQKRRTRHLPQMDGSRLEM